MCHNTNAVVNIFFCIPTIFQSFFCIFFMIAAFHGNFDDIDGARKDKLYLLSSRYLFTIKVYLVVPISRKTDKVFKLGLFVCYSWIVFLKQVSIRLRHFAIFPHNFRYFRPMHKLSLIICSLEFEDYFQLSTIT